MPDQSTARVRPGAALALAAALCASLCTTALAQQDFPTRPVRFIVPYDPGGNTTILARLTGERMAQAFGQQVLVDNRPGGNTVIGTSWQVIANVLEGGDPAVAVDVADPDPPLGERRGRVGPAVERHVTERGLHQTPALLVPVHGQSSAARIAASGVPAL